MLAIRIGATYPYLRNQVKPSPHKPPKQKDDKVK